MNQIKLWYLRQVAKLLGKLPDRFRPMLHKSFGWILILFTALVALVIYTFCADDNIVKNSAMWVASKLATQVAVEIAIGLIMAIVATIWWKRRGKTNQSPTPPVATAQQNAVPIKKRQGMHPNMKVGASPIVLTVLVVGFIYLSIEFWYVIVFGIKWGGMILLAGLLIWAIVWLFKRIPSGTWDWFSDHGKKILPITIAIVIFNSISWYVGWGWWKALWDFNGNFGTDYHPAFFFMFWVSILVTMALKIPGLAKFGVVAVIVGAVVTIVGPTINKPRDQQNSQSVQAGHWDKIEEIVVGKDEVTVLVPTNGGTLRWNIVESDAYVWVKLDGASIVRPSGLRVQEALDQKGSTMVVEGNPSKVTFRSQNGELVRIICSTHK